MACVVNCQLFGGKSLAHSSDWNATGQQQMLRDTYNTLHHERDSTRPLTIHVTQPASTPSGQWWHMVTSVACLPTLAVYWTCCYCTLYMFTVIFKIFKIFSYKVEKLYVMYEDKV